MNMTSDMILNPEKYGLIECPHCNGYGSSLKEEAERCTRCGGQGLVKSPEPAFTSPSPRKLVLNG